MAACPNPPAVPALAPTVPPPCCVLWPPPAGAGGRPVAAPLAAPVPAPVRLPVAGTAAPREDAALVLAAGGLDLLMPLHVHVTAGGDIAGCGRTLRKLLGAAPVGRRFFDLFRVLQPAGIDSADGLRRAAGEPLRLRFSGPGETGFRAVAVPLGGDGGVLVNLSFGLGLIEAVRAFGLTDADFAPTELVIELLWMAEAKTLALGESLALNARLQAAQRAAEDRALTDTLTGLRNRRALDAALSELAVSAVPFAVMHLDLDHFKQVNDSLGHAAGDLVLQHVGGILRAAVRQGDLTVRVGGDEFLALFPGLTDRSALHGIAARLVDEIARPVDFHGAACRVAASIGIALSEGHSRIDEILKAADAALYAAKRAGRGRAAFADPARAGF